MIVLAYEQPPVTNDSLSSPARETLLNIFRYLRVNVQKKSLTKIP